MNLREVLDALSGRALVRRWSDDELMARKAELEARLKDSPADVASSMEVAEYLVQRYLPRDHPLTRARWKRIRVAWQRRLAEGGAQGLFTPEALETERRDIAARQEARRAVLLNSYAMPAETFDRIVGRLLAQIIGPLEDALLNQLYIATGPDKWPASDARDELIGEIHETYVDLAGEWRRHYEHLRRAQNAGYAWVSVTSGRRCVCEPIYDRSLVSVEEALLAFEQPGSEALVLPSPNIACLTDECPRICPMSLSERDSPSTSTLDPAFDAWLDEMRGPRGATRPANAGLATTRLSP